MEATAPSPANKILSGLDASDLARLRPHLDQVDLPLRKVLEVRGRPIDRIYFLDSGIASMVVSAGSQHSVEVGLVGPESMTGQSVLLGSDRSPFEVFVQVAGSGWRITAGELVLAMEERPSLRHQLLRHAYIFQVQTSFTALANARYRLEERLARWLLMAQDRIGKPDLELTHEFLSVMLGVRRPGVTNALNAFETRGLICARRGGLTILDRVRLEEATNGAYGAPEAEYRRLLG